MLEICSIWLYLSLNPAYHLIQHHQVCLPAFLDYYSWLYNYYNSLEIISFILQQLLLEKKKTKAKFMIRPLFIT